MRVRTYVARLRASGKMESLKKNWHKFTRDPLSVVGLCTVTLIVLVAILAPYVTPFPEHSGNFVDFNQSGQSPNLTHLFGTDSLGRDIFSRVIFGFRYSLTMAVVVLALVAPPGILLGLIAGYFRGSFVETVIMRIADVFLAVPALVLALAICSVLTPSSLNAMIAVSLMWWPWYTRLVYGTASSLRNEFFVQSAEVIGAPTHHILFKEILPNCISSIFTKVTLDLGWVILIGASLSFVGLGAQPPTPDLGTMVSKGLKYMPEQWWISIFPALAIACVILGFNLLGDGIGNVFGAEEI